MLRFKPLNLFRRLYSSSSNNGYINLFLSNRVSDLKSLLRFHAYIITAGHTNNIFIASKLISLYSSAEKPELSSKVFDSIPQRDAFLWNSIIKSNFSNKNYAEAIDFYQLMRSSNTLPNKFTIPMVVTSCAELILLKDGANMHGLALKLGLFAGESAIGSSLIYMYAKCGCLEDASLVFDEIPTRDVVAWTALIIGYVQNGESENGLECFSKMHKNGGGNERPNFRTLEGGFQACGTLGALIEGMCLHGFALKTGILCQNDVKSSMFSMYCKCNAAKEAYLTFLELPFKDLMSWTLIIGVYSRLGRVFECLGMFFEMQNAGITPDGIVLSCVLLVFVDPTKFNEGKAFHGLIIRRNYELDRMVHASLLSMYCNLGLLGLAEKLFHGVNERENECWNKMVFAYGKVVGMEAKSIQWFRKMQDFRIESGPNTLISVISLCSKLRAILEGRSLHCYTIKRLIHDNISVFNSLIDMYAKNGNLNIAWRIFSRIQRDTITWNTMISSYTQLGYLAKALSLFEQMVLEGFKPNSSTLVTVISVCCQMASLEKAENIHNYIIEKGYDMNLSISTSLVDMYAKCGKLNKSREIFDLVIDKDVISWNVMISGYGLHGDGESALEVFKLMEKSSVEPNQLTFLALLSACVHSGLVEEGKELFGRMEKVYSLKPTLKHYACMVDLLGRAGNLCEAKALVMSMPVAPDGGLWGTLLSACRIHNNPEMGIRIAKLAIESDPENDGYYMTIINLYSCLGRWEEAEMVRKMMKEKGVEKMAGWSSV